MKYLVAIFVCFCICIRYNECAKKLPPYIKICKLNDPDLSKCYESTLQQLRPYLVKGIPEFSVPSIDPLRVEKITLEQTNTSTFNLNAVLTNLEFFGGKDFLVSNTYVDLKKDFVVKMTLTFPKLIMKGNYQAKGRVLVFDFDSDGIADGEFTNVVGNGTWHLKTVLKKGIEHLQVDAENIDMSVENISLHFNDIIKGNPELTNNVNGAVNDNIDVLYRDFKPLLTTTIGTVCREYTNRAYAAFPFNELFPVD